MSRRQSLIAVLCGVLAVCAAVAFGVLANRVSGAPDLWLTVSDDTYATYTYPAGQRLDAGADPRLIAGAGNGVAAITVLKFRVAVVPGGGAPRRAELRLSRAAAALPAHIELTHVPSSRWRESDLTGESAPRLGAVLGTVRPDPLDGSVTFDVSRIIRGPGTFSFAVTAPPGEGIAEFVAKESTAGGSTGTGPVPPMLWLSANDRPMPRAPAADPSPSADPSPTDPSPSGIPKPSDPVDPSPIASGDPDPTGTPDPTGAPSPTGGPTRSPEPTPTGEPSPTPSDEPTPSPSPSPSPSPTVTVGPSPGPSPSASASPSPTDPPDPGCVVGDKLVPTCGVLWGCAPAAHTGVPRLRALREFENLTSRPQTVYHAYHRGTRELFPTPDEVRMARDPANPRILFLNWKPTGASWAQIARGDSTVDRYLDRLAQHIGKTFPERFFFTVHHEPENDVRDESGSGYSARDFAAMFRYVVKRLRAAGATNLVSVVTYMAYIPWNVKPWFDDLYPGDDVVDWIGWDTYAYSDPGYGHGDFAEMMNRQSGSRPNWPGFYNWAAERFPDKPLMVAEWGVWYSKRNPNHQAKLFDSVAQQIELFPRVKALVYFDTPANQKGSSSKVDSTQDALRAYTRLGQHKAFQVRP